MKVWILNRLLFLIGLELDVEPDLTAELVPLFLRLLLLVDVDEAVAIGP